MLNGATIVFDLDGTLVDTAPDLTNALNAVLVRRSHDPVVPGAVRAAVGRGARVMIETALAMTGTEDDVDQMLAEFLVHYEANIAAESRPFPGAVAALDRLAAMGATLVVCTNKRERLTRLLLQALELEDYFAAIAGRDTFKVSKPDPGHVTGVIALAGGDPSRAVMVGDSDVDIYAAQAARVPSILVSFGYAAPPPGGPAADAVIDHFDALDETAISLLQRLPTKRHGRGLAS
ncbi:MAG: HAD-IA family hydrolase [Methyloceanibacter sp.]|uniref:HAD-IA family hydrolase n=1 Tax=Methyloceanibacter sp. TaxID=1965321 RepID=UPI003D6D2901